MAITRSNEQTSSTDTLLYTPSSVTDPCLYVSVSAEDVGNDEPITAILFGGTPMIIEGIGEGIVGANSNCIAVAHLVNPGTAAQTITVTGGQHDRMGIVAITLGNVNQSTPVDASDASFSPVATATMTVSATTSNDGSYVLSSAIGGNSTDLLNVTGATEFIDYAPPSSRAAVADSTQTLAGTYSHNWTCNVSGRNAAASIAFNLSTGGGAGNSASIGSVMPSMESSISASHTLPAFSASIISIMPSMSSVVSLTQSAPVSSLSIESIMPSMQSSLSVSHTVPEFNASVNSTMPSMISTINLSQIVSGNSLSVVSIMPSMQSAVTLSKVNPAFNVSVSSVMPSMTSAISMGAVNPGYNVSVSSTMPSMASDVSLSTADPVNLSLSVSSTMPAMISSIALVNGEIQAIQNIDVSFAANSISVEYIQSNINISYGE